MENLDDITTGGRVTRSLRKRLTSVDSTDPGSRPSTPQLTKLVSIPELSSPSRPLRATRRNSTTGYSTPSKTPAKTRNYTASERHDIENSLSKRPVRKSEVSGTDSHTPNKAGLLNVTPSKIDKVSDEGYNAVVKGTPSRRSTRLSSKSPTQLEPEKTPRTGPSKKVKPGPKSRRSKQISDSDSEVEVFNLEENPSDANDKNLNSNSPSRISQGLKGKKASPESKSKSIETINLLEESIVFNDKEDQNEDLKLKDEVREKVESSKNGDSLKKESSICDGSKESPGRTSKSSLSETSALIECDNKNESTLRLELSDDDNGTELETTKTPEKSASPKKRTNSQSQDYPCVESVVVLQKLSPKVIAKLCDESSVPGCPPNSKSVTFNDLDDEEGIKKSTYPKTPASIKCKGYTTMDSSKDSEDRSFQSDKGSSASFKDATAYNEEGKESHEYDIQENQSKESIEFHDATNGPEEDQFENAVEGIQECTPHKKQLHTKFQSSTPMMGSVSTSKPEAEENIKMPEENTKSKPYSPEKPSKKSLPVPNNSVENNSSPEQILQSSAARNAANISLLQQPKNIVSTNDNHDGVSSTVTEPINSIDADEKVDLFSKSWTHNVSGCATSAGKIDTITVNRSGEKGDQEVTSENWKLVDKQKTPPPYDAGVENVNKEESEEEETSFQKLEFADDEAMEAPDDYKSGDSMGEEERKEIEENQVLDRGESIGSEDSNEDAEEEEDGEENDSFVTSDSAKSLIDYSDDDHIEDTSIKSSRKKGNRHILVTSESESEQQSFAEKKTTKIKEIPKSNLKNRILDTSESENDEVSETKSNQINERMNNDSNEQSKPHNFEVSRMIVDSNDEETNTNETSQKTGNVLDEADKVSTDLIDEKLETGLNDDHSGDKRESRRHELTKDNTSELNETNCRIPSSPIEAKNETIKGDSRSRMSEALSKSTGQTVLDRSLNNEYGKPGEKYESFVQEGIDESTIDLNANSNLKINLSKHSLDRQISVEYEKAPTKHKICDFFTTGESEIPTKLSEENNDKPNAGNINSSQNESDLNLSIEKPNKSIETTNDLNEPKSESDYPENENTEEIEEIEIPETQEVQQASEINHSNETNAEESANEDSAEDTGYRILDTSESENDKVSETKSNQTNERMNNDSNEQSKPHNFEVSRMIVHSNDEEINTNETSQKTGNVLEEADKVSTDLIDKKLETGLNDDHSGDKRESTIHELTKDNTSELLSASFCQAKQNRSSIKGEDYVHHSSFSIAIGVAQERNNEIEDSDSSEFEKESNEKQCNGDKNLSESETAKNAKPNDIQINKDQEEELEKLVHSGKQFSILNRKRKSMTALEAESDCQNSKKQKRKSLQPISMEEFNPSQSLIENIEDHKRELHTKMATSKTRLSKSFSGSMPVKSCSLRESSASGEFSNEPKNKTEASNNSTPRLLNKGKNKDLGHALDRCDEILEAANLAKLESRLNYKQSKVIFPKSKKCSEQLEVLEKELEKQGSFVKDVKHSKEETTLALKQAFKASAKILMNETCKNKKVKLQTKEAECTEKRIPMEVLELLSITESSSEINKSHKETRSPFVHRMNCATGEIVEEALSPPKKKRNIIKKFELSTGTVLEEPVTPEKNTNSSGFRESPITPRTLGFKVRHILTAGQDKAPEIQTSHLRKRKQKTDDRKHVLPKSQWSQSGEFLEELLPSLNDKQKTKLKGASLMQTCLAGASTATLNALNFKNSTIFRKNIPRESSHEALKRKERQFARNQF